MQKQMGDHAQYTLARDGLMFTALGDSVGAFYQEQQSESSPAGDGLAFTNLWDSVGVPINNNNQTGQPW